MLISSEVAKKAIILIIAYLLLLLDSGFYFVAQGGIFLCVQLFLSIGLVLICKAHISRNSFWVLYVLIFLSVFGTIFSGDDVRSLAVTIIELVTGFCISCSFTSPKSETVKIALQTVMLGICICSLIVFFMTLLRFGFITHMPVFNSSNNVSCYFWGLSFSYIPGAYYIPRNLGLFWEPGAFQAYIIFALIYELFIGGVPSIGE